GAEDSLPNIETYGMYTYTTAPVGDVYGQMEIVYPSFTLTEKQKQYIANDISGFEKALFSFDYDKKDRGYQQYIDVDSFVDYFLINEFALNYDASGLSTYLYKDIRGKLHLCVWDFNSAFDNYELSSITPRTFRLQ
ncbi:MAG: CotH kinase family protein, partial [Anaerotignum sp.]|nr:CotH kinase family protein [Anaerotignum sp.]